MPQTLTPGNVADCTFLLLQWWSVETGEALQTFYTMGANLKKIHVSPDFSTFLTVDSIGILYVLKKVERGGL